MKLSKIVEDLYQQMTGKTDDHEIEMAITDLRSLAHRASQLADHLEKGGHQELEGWIQAKITKSADYIGSVYDNFMFSPDHECDSCGDIKEAMEPKIAYGDAVFTSMHNLVNAAKKLTKPENYSVLTDKDGKKVMLTTTQRAAQFAKEGNWMIVGKIDPNGNYREIEQSRSSGTQSWNSAPNKWALQEEKSTCCGKCGHFHVKGTSCPKPYLTGKRHCRNRPR